MYTTNKKVLGLIACAGIASLSQVALATEGYFAHGWGARHSALGGAGVASVTDASGQAINPAGLLSIEDDQFNIGLAIFNPNRQYTGAGGPGLAPNGTVESDSNYFPVPNISYNARIDENSAWGITMYGNGGMNTDYPAVTGGDLCPMPGAGVFCSGSAGVDMMQAFISVGYAVKVDNITFGIAPTLVAQTFEAKGVGFFAGSAELGFPSFTSNPAVLTNNGHDISTGLGIKLGILVDLGDGLSFGANIVPKINMSEFDDYAGLFADKGDFDIPSSWVIGLAYNAADNIKLMMDYKRINYSDVGSVANDGSLNAFQFNHMTGAVGNPLGSAGGPGFGWDDISAIKFGLEWQSSDDMTWRIGYAHNDNPINKEDVNLNILAPGVTTTHFTAGVKVGLEDKGAVEFFLAYMPTESVTGDAMMNPVFDMMISAEYGMAIDVPDQTITIEMDQLMVGVSWTMALGD